MNITCSFISDKRYIMRCFGSFKGDAAAFECQGCQEACPCDSCRVNPANVGCGDTRSTASNLHAVKLGPRLSATLLFAITLLVGFSALPQAALAHSQRNPSANNKYYYDAKVNTGRDNGYSDAKKITENDPHFGWDLGRFVVSGFTSRTDDDGTPVFLKNAGDQVQLSFVLKQNIDALDGDDNKRINDDANGYDQELEVEKSRKGFGRGTLIVRHTNFQNASTSPQVYRDYLPALKIGSETKVDLCEEGDYGVALDYEVETTGDIPVVSTIPFPQRYNNYRIAFRFKVRNSNTMMFLFDVKNNSELFNGSVTPDGFRIDLAGSHYLDVSVKREVMNETNDGLTEDTRFNGTATDGESFTKEGIYTIKVKNPTTNEKPTEKRIYVGENDVLKAVVANHMDVTSVKKRLEDGATVGQDGKFMQATSKVSSNAPHAAKDSSASSNAREDTAVTAAIPAALCIAAVFITCIIWDVRKKRSRTCSKAMLTQRKGGDEE